MPELDPTELDAEIATELPIREAMSLLTPTSGGLPIGSLNPDLLGGSSQSLPVDQTDPATTDPTLAPGSGDITQSTPSNEIQATNLNSVDSTSSASATQTAPTSGS